MRPLRRGAQAFSASDVVLCRPGADERSGTMRQMADITRIEDVARRLRCDIVEMIAEAGSRPPRRLALGGRHRRDAVLRRHAARPRATRTGPSATASCSRRATRRRCSTPRSPRPATSPREQLADAAQARLACCRATRTASKTPGVEVSTGSLGQGLAHRQRHRARAAARRQHRRRACSACWATASCRRARCGRRRCSRRTTGSTTSSRSSTTTACRSTARVAEVM